MTIRLRTAAPPRSDAPDHGRLGPAASRTIGPGAGGRAAGVRSHCADDLCSCLGSARRRDRQELCTLCLRTAAPPRSDAPDHGRLGPAASRAIGPGAGRRAADVRSHRADDLSSCLGSARCRDRQELCMGVRRLTGTVCPGADRRLTRRRTTGSAAIDTRRRDRRWMVGYSGPHRCGGPVTDPGHRAASAHAWPRLLSRSEPGLSRTHTTVPSTARGRGRIDWLSPRPARGVSH